MSDKDCVMFASVMAKTVGIPLQRSIEAVFGVLWKGEYSVDGKFVDIFNEDSISAHCIWCARAEWLERMGEHKDKLKKLEKK